MNWSNLPPLVLEKIFDSTAKLEQRYNNNWLDSLCKLSEVCVEWRNTILSSKALFATGDCGRLSIFGPTCQRVLETGLLSKVSKIDIVSGGSIWETKRLKLLVEVWNENSLSDIYFSLYSGGWCDEYFELCFQLLSTCSKLTTTRINFGIIDQRTAEWFWRIPQKVIHCSQNPKHLIFNIRLFHCGSIDWGFVRDLDFNGKGSIQNIEFVFSGNYRFQECPNWTYFTDAVSINQVTISNLGCHRDGWRFIETLKAKRIDFKSPDITDSMINFFNNFETLYIHLELISRLSPSLIEKINHPNAHVVGEFRFMTEQYALNEWTQALRESTVKTYTCSATQTVFACNNSLLSNLIYHERIMNDTINRYNH